MDVYEMRPFPFQHLGNFSLGFETPSRSCQKGKALRAGIRFNLPVASLVDGYMVSRALQNVALLLESHVLASRLLVRVMREKYVHVDGVSLRIDTFGA